MKLTEQQLRFFNTFGFLFFPGLFAKDINTLSNKPGLNTEGTSTIIPVSLQTFTNYIGKLIQLKLIHGSPKSKNPNIRIFSMV